MMVCEQGVTQQLVRIECIEQMPVGQSCGGIEDGPQPMTKLYRAAQITSLSGISR
jgi:hypothetical protein